MAIMKAQGTNPKAPSKAPSRPSKRPATPRSPTPRPRASGTTRPLSGPRAIPKMAEGGTVRSASGYAVRGNPRQAPEMPPPPRRKVTPKAATIQKMPSQLRAQGQKWLGGSPRFSVTDGPYGKLTPMAEGGTVRRKVAPKAAMIQRRPSQLRSQGQKWVAPMKKGGTVRRKK